MTPPDSGSGAKGRQAFGSVLSADPLVTVGKRSHFHESPAGIGPLACAVQPQAPSLHFLFLAWSHETPEAAEAAARDIAAAFRPYPRAQVVVMANTPLEAQLLQAAGLEVAECNLLLAVDESRFAITAPDPAFPPCQAVYVAALEPYKRHELSVGIDDLRLLYWRPSAAHLAQTRALLPGADFANHRVGGGPHRLITGAQYCAAVQSARVGLCLSDVEGVMRASIEYALLGLPIVTTSATGGRVEFMGQHVRVVPFDATAVAKAVTVCARDAPQPAVIRADALARLARERARFSALAEDHGQRAFGQSLPPLAHCHPRDWGLWRTRDLDAILAGLHKAAA